MAKKDGGGVYKIVEVVGLSKTSWEDAGRKAEKGKVVAYRTRVSLSFKYEA